jgi:serine/threonine protein kinase
MSYRFHRPPDRSTPQSGGSGELSKLAPGMLVGDYRLEVRIGAGGMGQVWKAVQTSLQRPVAIKFMREDRVDERSVAFFAREARAGGRMNHPGLVTVYAAGQAGELHWIAQELVPGGATLRDFIEDARKSAHPQGEYYRALAGFLIELCDAMQFAHDAGVIHRDLKPNNILVTPDDRPKVTDFGLARLTDEASISEAFALQGTPYYMSPEQVMGKLGGIDHRADIFSLGAVIYEALTLRKAFDADTQAAVFYQILRDDPPDPRSIDARIPDDLAIVCMRALEKRRRDRFASMRELGDELRRYLRGEPLITQRPGLGRRAGKWIRRRQAVSVALGLGVALLGLGAWSVSRIQSAHRQAVDQKKENLVIQAERSIDDACMDEVERYMAEYGRLDPDDFLPQLLLARGYAQNLRLAEAEREFAAAKSKGFHPERFDAQDAESLFRHALALVIDDPNQRPKAIESLQAAVGLNPKLRAGQLLLYQLQKDGGDRDAAEQTLSEFQSHLATGEDYYRIVSALRAELQGRIQEAIDALLELSQRVSQERAKELRLDRILGRLELQAALDQVRRGAKEVRPKLERAEQHLAAALDANPRDLGSWVNRSVLHAHWYRLDRRSTAGREHLELARGYADRAVSEQPQYPLALGAQLDALVLQATEGFRPESGDLTELEDAAAKAKSLRALCPSYENLELLEARIAYYLGMAAEARRDPAQTRELYSRSIEQDPNQVLPRLWLGQSDFQQENYAAAFDQFRTAQELFVRFAEEDTIRTLRPEFRVVLDIWTFGSATHSAEPDAMELAGSARDRIDEALDRGEQIDPVELLNYAEFLAKSPNVELRDCEAAQRLLKQFDLVSRLRGSIEEQTLLETVALIQGCR